MGVRGRVLFSSEGLGEDYKGGVLLFMGAGSDGVSMSIDRTLRV